MQCGIGQTNAQVDPQRRRRNGSGGALALHGLPETEKLSKAKKISLPPVPRTTPVHTLRELLLVYVLVLASTYTFR